MTRDRVSVFAETTNPASPPSAAADFLESVNVRTFAPVPGARNVFQCELEKRPPFLRFTFTLPGLLLRMGGRDVPIFEYMKSRELNFVGFDGAGTVTAFVI